MATRDDINEIKRLLAIRQNELTVNGSNETARLILVLTLSQLKISTTKAANILQRFSAEVTVILKIFLASLIVCLKDILLALPQLVMLYRIMRRLPQAISLVLRDDISFEDALGRIQSLQFQQFKHWSVFEASLKSTFDELPGMKKVMAGEYVLTSPKYHAPLTAQNWSQLIRPGSDVRMAIKIKRISTSENHCPRGCESAVTKITDRDYCCNNCCLLFVLQRIVDLYTRRNVQFRTKIPVRSIESAANNNTRNSEEQQQASSVQMQVSSKSRVQPSRPEWEGGSSRINLELQRIRKVEAEELQLETEELKAFKRISLVERHKMNPVYQAKYVNGSRCSLKYNNAVRRIKYPQSWEEYCRGIDSSSPCSYQLKPYLSGEIDLWAPDYGGSDGLQHHQ